MRQIVADALLAREKSVLVSAANERSPHMGTVEFEDELVRLVRGFLSALPQ